MVGVKPTTARHAPGPVATARLFRVLSDPTRVAILELLMERPHNVSELVDATSSDSPPAS